MQNSTLARVSIRDLRAMYMNVFAVKCVELVEDLVELRVVFIAAERLSDIVQRNSWPCVRDGEIVERRRTVLENLSHKFPVGLILMRLCVPGVHVLLSYSGINYDWPRVYFQAVCTENR